MLMYPDIDPVAIALGPVKVHWYGLMYLVGFIVAWWLGRVRAGRADSGWDQEQISDLIFYGALGVVLGGRIGFTLFYNLEEFISHPAVIFRIWEGGMSFHGGMLGVFLALWLFGRKHGKTFFQVSDFVAPLVPIGLGAGRIANFINGELWGKQTEVAWGMVVQRGGPALHPSQLYEAFLEGLVLFLILWLYSSRPRPLMAVSGLFLLCYGVFRFMVEFVRLPDDYIGYLAFGWVTMGQVLSAPMILVGLGMLVMAYRKNSRHTGRTNSSPETAGENR